jgi:glycosyltransferase involved in cell wall biosynthesis
MAAGLAVAAADAPSNRAVIRPGETGLLCHPDDVEACAAAVGALADDRARCLVMGRAARAASAAHDWDATLGQVLQVYREATARAEAPPVVRPVVGPGAQMA